MKTLFQEQNPMGVVGEQLVLKHKESQGLLVFDVSKDKAWRDKGVDLIVDLIEWIDVKYEPKSDITNNFFIEIWQDTRYKIKGWYQTSQADKWCLIQPKTKTAYELRTEDVKRYIETHNVRTAICDDRPRGVNRIREGYLINIFRDIPLIPHQKYILG